MLNSVSISRWSPHDLIAIALVVWLALCNTATQVVLFCNLTPFLRALPNLDIHLRLDICFLSRAEFEWTEMYFMALIDILTDYGVKKRTAQAAKTMKHGAGAEISTVPPDQYARRFLDFMRRAIK